MLHSWMSADAYSKLDVHLGHKSPDVKVQLKAAEIRAQRSKLLRMLCFDAGGLELVCLSSA